MTEEQFDELRPMLIAISIVRYADRHATSIHSDPHCDALAWVQGVSCLIAAWRRLWPEHKAELIAKFTLPPDVDDEQTFFATISAAVNMGLQQAEEDEERPTGEPMQ